LGNVGITSTTSLGFVTGTVTRSNNTPLSNILVQGLGASQATTGSNGRYLLSGDPGVVEIIANPGNANLNYVTLSSAPITVNLGQFTSGVDFKLTSGGRIKGYVSIGASPLPDVPVTASISGVVIGEGVTGSDGYFYINNLATATYAVEVQLEQGESYSPTTSALTLSSPGAEVWAASYTVTNAFGAISGTVRKGASTIETGVLIIASTSTISGSPPDIDATVRSGSNNYYQVSSFADGTYHLPLPSGTSGTLTYNIYGWYTTFNGVTANPVRMQTTATVSGGVETTGVNLTW
jgi:hypothetical protein